MTSHTITYMHLFSLCVSFIYIALVGKSLYGKQENETKNKSLWIFYLFFGKMVDLKNYKSDEFFQLLNWG